MYKTTKQILASLRKQNEAVSGKSLCEGLGISRVAVSKHVKTLRNLGYNIESMPKRGHKLISVPNIPYESEVYLNLKTSFIAKNYKFLNSADSTNNLLMKLPDNEAVRGTVFATDTQTSGRGRLDHEWFSPAGKNLYFSVLLRPKVSPYSAAQLPLVTASAILRALHIISPNLEAKVKWPNDILVNNRKIAGVLCEMDSDMDAVHRVVIGIGINVNLNKNDLPKSLRPIATSIKEETGTTVNRPRLLAAILNSLEECYDLWMNKGLKPLLAEIEKKSVLTEKKVTLITQAAEISGTVTGIAENGMLVLKKPDGSTINVPSGEVHIRK